MKKISVFAFLAGTLLGCSYEKNTWTSKSYHNLTAHYNGYYYAHEEVMKIEESILQANQDDYNKILRLFPTFDSSMAKGFEKEIEEAIKMASIAIQRHPNSKWVDDAYILVGKARLYGLDWGNAIETFKYVNSKSEDPDARHMAIIQLIRTFTEHKEFNNAQAAIDYLLKEKLSKKNKKEFYMHKAYYHQVLEDYDNMVRSLTVVSPLLKKSDRSGRIYFIIGQVYQKLGFEAEAFNFYRKCLSTNPEYETDFYARLNMAQVAEISRSRDITAARKSFRRLLKDSKNRDFKDKVYYELGAFELKQKNLDQAMSNFNLAIREGSDSRIDGVAYLRLGEIHYDTLKNYPLSQAYYDSAITSLPTDFENYTAIKKRQEVLNEFVTQLETITWQDSLLTMASMDSVAIRARIDSVFAEKRRKEELAAGKKKKRKNNRIEIDANDVNIFNAGTEGPAGADWYFGNPSAMALGESEFRRVWGDIKLEDNWRRSQRISIGPSNIAATQQNQSAATEAAVTPTGEPVDPVTAEYDRIAQQIPRTQEQVDASLKTIEDAYFRLGDIYYFELNEKYNAAETYDTLLERFPDSEYAPEVVYKLYLIHKDTDPEKAQQLAELLQRKYSYSTFAKILANPDYLKESSQTAEKQKDMYQDAYENFRVGNYLKADLMADEALALGETAFSPNLQLLKILILGKMEPVDNYRQALSGFVEKNPDSELVPYTNKLLEASKKFEEREERAKVISFTHEIQAPHYFVLVYDSGTNLRPRAAAVLERLNQRSFPETGLRTSNLDLNDQWMMTIVSDFPDGFAAQNYLKAFTEKVEALGELDSRKFQKLVISSDNFNIFYRTKGLHEYIEFFEKKYNAETP